MQLKCSVQDAQKVLTASDCQGARAAAGMPLWEKAQLSLTLSGQKGILYLSRVSSASLKLKDAEISSSDSGQLLRIEGRG